MSSGALDFVVKEELIEQLVSDRAGDVLSRWKKEHPHELLDLSGADLSYANLSGLDLREANMSGANLCGTNLIETNLFAADLSGAELEFAKLSGANLYAANLRRANLAHADLSAAKMERAKLNGARLTGADLTGANLADANLTRATLAKADLSATDLSGSRLQGASCRLAAVDGKTLLSECDINSSTDFTGVGLGSARIDPELRRDLEYNIRRLSWSAWYRRWRTWPGIEPPEDWEERFGWAVYFAFLLVWLIQWPIRLLMLPVPVLVWSFWLLSDYGRSTARIIAWFIGLSILFAVVYLLPTNVHTHYLPSLGATNWQPFVTNLSAVESGESEVTLPPRVVVVRSVYFSVVAMTTLGFGDIHAHPQSIAGHVLVAGQVLIGYVLLGALITRLSIMFQSVG